MARENKGRLTIISKLHGWTIEVIEKSEGFYQLTDGAGDVFLLTSEEIQAIAHWDAANRDGD